MAEENPPEDSPKEPRKPRLTFLTPIVEALKPFAFVLLSFKGRINRKMFWIRGVLMLLIIEVITYSTWVLVAFLMLGDIYFQGILSQDTSPPAVTKQFSQKGDGPVVGAVNADTGAAQVEVRMTADNATTHIGKKVIIGGRRMKVIAARKPGDGPPSFDLEFNWVNYPVFDKAAEAAEAAKKVEKTALVLDIVYVTMTFLFLWPWFAIAVKRYHDRDISGWWSLVSLIPLIGFFWLLVALGFRSGTGSENRFGPEPA